MLLLRFPLLTCSEANLRQHWSKVSARKREQFATTRLHLLASRCTPDSIRSAGAPVIVLLVREGGRRMDSDNLAGAFKAIRDAIAAWIGIDDGSCFYEWKYEQKPGPATGKKPGRLAPLHVTIQITPRNTP